MKECIEVLLSYLPVGVEENEGKLAIKYMNLKLTQRHKEILLGTAKAEEISQRNDLILWGLLTIEGKLTTKGEYLVREVFPIGNRST